MNRLMAIRSRTLSRLVVMCLALLGALGSERGVAADTSPVNVCATGSDAAALVQAVGGEAVNLTGYVKGEDDPHVLTATPSMIRALADAELLVLNGLGMEQAWLTGMLDLAGNSKVKEGGPGYLDLSINLRTIVGPEGRGVPNSFHPEDNPHYLADPVEGVKAAYTIAEHLAKLRPDMASTFQANADSFAKSIMTALVGQQLAQSVESSRFEELAIAIETGNFQAFPQLVEDPELLGGWLGALRPYAGTKVVGDHDLWPYLARRYSVHVIGYLEPQPGVPPTTPHLQKIINKMKEANCQIILTVRYFDPRHAAFVSETTGASIVPMAHQPQSRLGTDSYLDFVNYNAQQLLDAVKAYHAR